MIRLLILRVVPLIIRPSAVLAEKLYIENGYVIVTVLPITMMALTFSSIPVHLDYYRSSSKEMNHTNVKLTYSSALTWLVILSIVVLTIILSLGPIDIALPLIVAIIFSFFIEKMADESSRKFEFKKKFFSWFIVQSIRSGWILLPIISGLMGMNYINSFLIVAIITSGFMTVIFVRLTGFMPQLEIEGLKHIRNNLIFLIGNSLPSMLQQLPRIIITRVFPQYAHIYLVVAQLCQGMGLLYNVRFQIPYRTIISRRTAMFQRLTRPALMRLTLGVMVVAGLYASLSHTILLESKSAIIIGLLLTPVLLAESLSYAITTTYLGYIQWHASKIEAALTYIICFMVSALIEGMIYISISKEYMTILNIPPVVIFVGSVWINIIYWRHFSRYKKRY